MVSFIFFNNKFLLRVNRVQNNFPIRNVDSKNLDQHRFDYKKAFFNLFLWTLNRRYQGSVISRFDIANLIDPQTESIAFPRSATTQIYYSNSTSNFAILKDQKSVLGVKLSGKCNTIILENMTNPEQPQITFKLQGHFIYTIALNEKLGVFLAGDYSGNLIQYSLKDKHLFRIYQSVKIKEVISSTVWGKYCFLGGINSCIRIVDMDAQRIVGPPIPTAIECIKDLEVCRIEPFSGQPQKTLLGVCGTSSDYSDLKTDLFDIEGLMRVQLTAGLKIKKPISKIAMKSTKILKNAFLAKSYGFDDSLQGEVKGLRVLNERLAQEVRELTESLALQKTKYKKLKQKMKEQVKSQNEENVKNRELTKQLKSKIAYLVKKNQIQGNMITNQQWRSFGKSSQLGNCESPMEPLKKEIEELKVLGDKQSFSFL